MVEPTQSWEIDGKTVETVSDFSFGGKCQAVPFTAGLFALKKSLELPRGRSGISETQQERPILGNKRTEGSGGRGETPGGEEP